MDPDQAVDALRSYIAGFLDAHLRSQSAGANASLEFPEYPGALLTTGRQALCQQGRRPDRRSGVI
jgi:hypothetical protein